MGAADPHGIALALRVLGLVQLDLGRTESAEEWLRQCLEMHVETVSAMGAADLGFSLAEHGHLSTALELGEAAVRASAGTEDGAWTLSRLARIHVRAGRRQEAEARLRHARQVVSQGPSGFAWIQLQLAAGEADLANGGAAAARDVARRLTTSIEKAGVRCYLGDALLLCDAALESLGEHHEALACRATLRELALCTGSRRLLERLPSDGSAARPRRSQ
jgi:tetratricopeptide (TPR) repeat protein